MSVLKFRLRSGREPLVAMMQTADLWNGYDLTRADGLAAIGQCLGEAVTLREGFPRPVNLMSALGQKRT